jgi:nitroreductase
MSQTTEQNLQTAEEVIRARHAVKEYISDYKIPQAELNEILELAATAPSAWNLQHWRYLVIIEQANKERVLPIAYGQRQVADSSATIVILGDLEADKSAEPVFSPAVEAGFMSQELYTNLVGQIKGAYQDKQTAREQAFLNAGFSAMQLMLAAKTKGYDTCPIGGFDREALIKELNIPARYVPVMLITLGKAKSPARPSTRFSLDQLVIKESF